MVLSPRTAPSSRSARQALPRDARGFTIVEVAMAAFILAFGIATSIVAMQSGFKFIDVARGTTLSSQILQSEIERIRMMSWSGVTDASTMIGTHNVNLSSMFSASSELASRFTVTRTVALDSARPSDVANITLAVTWTSFDGRSHTRRFQTRYVKNGLYDYYYTLARP